MYSFQQQAISNIQTVKVIRKGGRGIPTAFEVFANDETYVFKARDAENVEQWVQCLQIAIARTQRLNRDSISSDINVPRWASLGRPVKISSNATQYLQHGSQIRLWLTEMVYVVLSESIFLSFIGTNCILSPFQMTRRRIMDPIQIVLQTQIRMILSKSYVWPDLLQLMFAFYNLACF